MADVMRQEYRQLTEKEVRQVRELKELGSQFHAFIDNLGSSRELSLAKTRIEEAVMWVVKAITEKHYD